MQDVQVDKADLLHWKHPFLRSSRAQVLEGHLLCDDNKSVIMTDLLLYLALMVSMSRQLLLRFLRAAAVRWISAATFGE